MVKSPAPLAKVPLRCFYKGYGVLVEQINAGSPTVDRAEDTPYLKAHTPATFSYIIPSLRFAVASGAVPQ